ncbi:MAG: hypothetical protein ACRC46_11430 [Thermoguttaceae bacterium]
MSSYTLTCDCGATHAVATHQAGQSLQCRCGATLAVPSLLQLKRLPVSDATEESATPAASHAAVSRRWLVRIVGGIALMVTIPIFVFAILSYPHAYEVLGKRKAFNFNGAQVLQDSTPIPVMEQWILVLGDDDIDAMPPMTAYYYFDALRDGPSMSFNFRENYQTFIDWYYIRVGACGLLVILSAGVFVVSWLLPQRDLGVRVRSGSEWRK